MSKSSSSSRLSNSQACSPSKIHGSSRDGRSPGCGRRPPPSRSRRKRSRRSSGPWAKISSTALAIAASSSAPSASSRHAEPVAQEGAVAGVVGQAQRVEAGRRAAGDPLVAAAERAKENLRSAVLVEQDRARRELLRLRGEEVQHHRLARTRRADDREIAEVALVEVEEDTASSWSSRRRVTASPQWLPRGAAHREAVKRDEARRVGAGDQRAADDILLVAGELAPEGRLEIDVLAHRDRADVGQRGGRVGGRALERLEVEPLRTSRLR